ncbi:hypothetical protein M3Y99_01703000 [Aphelenchoides fujianensis]|nr:hypothetical protein M3Y99_01703000 [Aphelenchoides fujianensis]
MDLSFFYKSAEWDLLSLTSARHSVLYASCCGPEKYVDITFYFDLRTEDSLLQLYGAVATSNFIIPCFLISFLTTFVFYLSHHKITFSISILVTLTVFFLVLIDIIPPTSLVIPMFGRYLITTMVLVSLSTIVSVVTVNFRFRSGTAQQMTPRMRSIFLNCLAQSAANLNKPPLRPSAEMFAGAANLLNNWQQSRLDEPPKRDHAANCAKPESLPMYASLHVPNHAERTGITDLGVNYAAGIPQGSNSLPFPTKNLREEARETKEKINDLILGKLLQQVKLISEHFRRQEEEMEISDDWRFVAMVLDRLFLIIFSILNFGTFLILLEAPTLHEHIEPMNITFPTKPLGQANIYSMTGN